MVEPLAPQGQHGALPIKQAHLAVSGSDMADTPQWEIEFNGQRRYCHAFLNGRRERQFVVVASGKLALAGQRSVNAGRQSRQLFKENFDIEPGAFGNVSDIRQQAV